MALPSVTTERTVFRFDIPERSAPDYGASSVGLVRLTGTEEMLASERADGERMALAYHLAMTALREVNGKPVSLSDGTVDEFLLGCDPRLRSLVLQAYAHIHNAEDDDTKDFLGSCKATVG